MGAAKSWPKRHHPPGIFQGLSGFPRAGLGSRGGSSCELEQAVPWTLGRVFEQNHRLGWAPEGNGALGSVPGDGMSAQLVFLLHWSWALINKGAAWPVNSREVPGSAPAPALPSLQGKRRPIRAPCLLCRPAPYPRGGSLSPSCRAARQGGWDGSVQSPT